MLNISILQDNTVNLPITLPDSFVVLRSTDATSELFFGVLERFLKDEKRKVLEKLRDLAAADVANFLDEVYKPIATSHD